MSKENSRFVGTFISIDPSSPEGRGKRFAKLYGGLPVGAKSNLGQIIKREEHGPDFPGIDLLGRTSHGDGDL